MLGYCGINCEECVTYKATVGADLGLLKRAATTYGTGPEAYLEHVCLGCTPSDQPFLAKYCASCKIRACAVERDVPNCAACDDSPTCAELRGFLATVSPEARATERMELLRARFRSLRQERGQAA